MVVDPKVDLKMTARRLLWGRAINAGQVTPVVICFIPLCIDGHLQVCTAPEYVLVPREVQDALIAEFKEASVPCTPCSGVRTRLISNCLRYATFYPDGPENSDSLSRIVSQKHAARIKGLLDKTKGEIVLGGQVDVEKKYVAPTIVNNVSADDSLMSE